MGENNSMTYRSAHQSTQAFKIGVFAVMLAIVLLTIVLMFVHPSGALFMVWMGLVVFAIAAVVGKVFFQGPERAAARQELREHHCPTCGEPFTGDSPDDEPWECASCGAVFSPSGAVQADGRIA
jgi:hypothetical protein